MDVGIVKGGDYPDGRYFGNGVGIGFDAATGFVAAKIRWTRGLLLYLIAAIETIFVYYKAPTIRLQYEGKEFNPGFVDGFHYEWAAYGRRFLLRPQW